MVNTNDGYLKMQNSNVVVYIWQTESANLFNILGSK
jgi:hypothetical protein